MIRAKYDIYMYFKILSRVILCAGGLIYQNKRLPIFTSLCRHVNVIYLQIKHWRSLFEINKKITLRTLLCAYTKFVVYKMLNWKKILTQLYGEHQERLLEWLNWSVVIWHSCAYMWRVVSVSFCFSVCRQFREGSKSLYGGSEGPRTERKQGQGPGHHE